MKTLVLQPIYDHYFTYDIAPNFTTFYKLG